ncbi:hypothetical protein EG856_00290 [Mycoplasmopsis phocirhinis]|uniref:Uncharacterized protein n=1 Tax=Mycoplasmopsis phocirhinis TaxID=142650 RepID=A0A4P6MSV3_9BACT|nr:hypothetical protein [Mycoplasmopsis phocirhinis]QBF34377.1 hypothetical protein EG856_00290 [Mycoplasmopsis phocirhinis]
MSNILIPNNIPSRQMNLTLVILDIIFLLFLYSLLIYKKKYMTTLFALAGGLLYFVVDWGIFYKALNQRVVIGANPFWFLLWLSMSYGTTNFLLIWLAIKKDKHLLHFALIIVIWWICSPIISKLQSNAQQIIIWRHTGKYHWVMAMILVIGYFALITYNLITKQSQLPIVRMLIIGISVQFAWEFALMINGIRKLQWGPIIIDSLIETNLGIPYIYLIQKSISKKWNENLSKNTK